MTRKLLTTVAAGALFATAFAPAAFSQTQPAGHAGCHSDGSGRPGCTEDA